MTDRLLTAAAVALFASTAFAQWDDEPSRRHTSASDNAGPAPTSLMVPTDANGDDWAGWSEDDDEFEETPARRGEKKRRRSKKPKRPEAETWAEPAPGKGLVVIQEDTSVSSTVTVGVPDADRIGRSLGASDEEGLSLGARRRPGAETFRIRADSFDESSAAPDGRDTGPGATTRAPMGIVVPVDRDFDDAAVRSGDPWADDGRRRPNTGGAVKQRSLLDDLSESSSTGYGIRTYGATGGSGGFGDGSSIPVEEVKIDYSSRPIQEEGQIPVERVEVDYQDTTFITADKPRQASPRPTPPEPEPAPAPPREPARVQTAPKPEPVPEPVRQRRVVGQAAEPADKILSYDPFARLEEDLAEAEGRAPRTVPPVEKKLPEYEIERPMAQPLEVPTYEAPEMAVRPVEAPEDTRTARDPSLVGLSALVGAGANIARDPVSGYTTDFAWGLNLRLHPAFTGPISLDVSYWRAARSDGTPVVTVNSAWNHVGFRIFYTKEYPKGIYMGFGGGVLLTGSSAEYIVNDGSEEVASASQFRPGGDLSAILGVRFKPFEVRLDLRTMVRGGLRLDFLPVLSFGVSI